MRSESTIDPSTKWKDYSGDTLYLWNGEVLYTATEDAENLSDEDKARGCKDGWFVDIFSSTANYDWIPTGGYWTETKIIDEQDYTIEQIVKRLLECDLWEDDWVIVEPSLGACLRRALEVVEEVYRKESKA